MNSLDILIVDDSAAIRKILQRILRQTDLQIGEVYEAGDGVEALAQLKEHRVGLVLADMNMPNMDGLQLLAQAKHASAIKNIPFIMISTEGGQDKVMKAAQLGAAAYVRKPFTATQIVEKVTGV